MKVFNNLFLIIQDWQKPVFVMLVMDFLDTPIMSIVPLVVVVTAPMNTVVQERGLWLVLL
jgi:hypothetical protein